MFSLEPELSRLRDEGVLAPDAAAALIARERREVVSVYAEIRFLTWAGVMIIMTGVGIIVAKNIDKLGPITIATAIGLAAAACYAYAITRRAAARTSLVDDYILLLGALLASTEVGYIEHQFNQRYLLPLIVFHAVTAYWFESRLVLSVALGALATYFGIERRESFLWNAHAENAQRAFLCSGIVFAWRFIDQRFHPKTTFTRVFDHFGTNLAFWGAFLMMTENETRVFGCLLAVGFAIGSAFFGVRKREETFVIYAWIYGVLAVNILTFHVMHEFGCWFVPLSTIAAIVGLYFTHQSLRRKA